MKRLYIIFFSLIFFLISGCSLNDDEPNFHFVPLKILSAEVPDSFQLNQSYQISVIYEIPDDCTSYNGFQEPNTDNHVRDIVVFGTTRTDQVSCAQVVKEGRASFSFICLYDQTYVFRFWQGENAEGEQDYFEIEVPVEN